MEILWRPASARNLLIYSWILFGAGMASYLAGNRMILLGTSLWILGAIVGLISALKTKSIFAWFTVGANAAGVLWVVWLLYVLASNHIS